MRNYSQNNEQQIILRHFVGYRGTFLDLGSYTGVELSNVRALAEKGWDGVMVEASPAVFRKLQENYREYPNIQLCQCAVGTETKWLEFYDNHNAVGTLHASQVDRWNGKERFDMIKVACVEINELLSFCHYKTFDFISCDIEGEDLNVISRLDFDKLQTRMVCVEWNGKDKILFDNVLLPFGFRLIHRNGENLIYYRKY